MNLTPNIHNQLSVKSIDRFSITALILSIPCLFFYVYHKNYILSVFESIIILLFILVIYLNRKSYVTASRLGLIFATNIGVLMFSVGLGFQSGIFFYLFAAPYLVFLLFSINNKIAVYTALTSYVLTFLALYIFDYYGFKRILNLSDALLKITYVINFLSAIIFTFVLSIVYARGIKQQIDLLYAAKLNLEEQDESLKLKNAELKELNSNLQATFKDKEVLLSEIHHRVKNNLAIISGLIDLQELYIKDQNAAEALRESKNRIKSIAVLHEKFYETNNFEKIEIKSFVDELIYFNQLNFRGIQKNINIHSEIDNIQLTLEKAMPLSLLLNELFTNSSKHAFKDRQQGNINFTFKRDGDLVKLNYKDDGEGYDLDEIDKGNSLGLNLVEAFSKQLKAKVKSKSEKGSGTEYYLEFNYVEGE